jgi:hypothetical protein
MHTPFGKSFVKNRKSPNGLIKSKPWRRHLRRALFLYPTSLSLKCHFPSKEKDTGAKNMSLSRDRQTGGIQRSDRCQQRHNHLLDGQEAKKKQTKGGKIEKDEASSSLAKELEALKSENASLVCKYDSLARQYDKVIKSFACVAAVDQENERLEEKLGKLTSDHMALQADHKGLECLLTFLNTTSKE